MIDWFTQIILEVDILFFILLISSEKNNPSRILGWGLLFIVLPIVGFLLYIFIGQTVYSDHVFKAKGLKDKRISDAVRIDGNDLDKEPDREYKTVMHSMKELGGHLYTNDNEVKLYTLGEDNFRDLYADLRAAKKYIHFEYYIIRNDELGNELIDILTEKVKEGVEVKLMTDDFGIGKGPKKAIKNFQAAGGEFGLFHKVIWLILSPKKNNRNHRKLAIIDGRVGYCGGFNVGDEYLGKGPLGYWRDSSVRVTGSAVLSLQLRFQKDWEYSTGKPLCPPEKIQDYYQPFQAPEGDDRAMIISGGPDVAAFNPVRMQYISLISNAKKSVYIHTPYFGPDQSLVDAMSIAASKGIDVKVIIPDKPDHMFVFWNNIKSANDVMKHGVKVYMYNRGFVHSKTMVVDGELCSVGSANMDDRSLVLNFETNAFIISKKIGKEMDEAFEEDLKYCTEYTMEDYANISGYDMVRVMISQLFVGLS
jgi:cardiolipin synthase